MAHCFKARCSEASTPKIGWSTMVGSCLFMLWSHPDSDTLRWSFRWAGCRPAIDILWLWFPSSTSSGLASHIWLSSCRQKDTHQLRPAKSWLKILAVCIPSIFTPKKNIANQAFLVISQSVASKKPSLLSVDCVGNRPKQSWGFRLRSGGVPATRMIHGVALWYHPFLFRPCYHSKFAWLI